MKPIDADLHRLLSLATHMGYTVGASWDTIELVRGNKKVVVHRGMTAAIYPDAFFHPCVHHGFEDILEALHRERLCPERKEWHDNSTGSL